MIVREEPTRVVEVGSGFSTRVARAAIESVGLQTELHIIDPEPRTSIEDVADVVERVRVEVSSLVDRTPEPGSLLFIDSSHVIESGGDLPFLYGSLLPTLPKGILVHVHDIFLPFEYPAVYRDLGYGEHYLLHALLAHSPKYSVVFTSYYMSDAHPEAMRSAFGPEAAQGAFRGASMWFRTVD